MNTYMQRGPVYLCKTFRSGLLLLHTYSVRTKSRYVGGRCRMYPPHFCIEAGNQWDEGEKPEKQGSILSIGRTFTGQLGHQMTFRSCSAPHSPLLLVKSQFILKINFYTSIENSKTSVFSFYMVVLCTWRFLQNQVG